MVFSIPSLIEFTCKANNISEIYETISFKFNKRFTKRLGDANPNNRVIRFSYPLWERASLEERKEVVVHETCHIIATTKAWHSKSYISDPHGIEWQTAMKRAGYENPSKFHTIDRKDLKKNYLTHYIQCACVKRRVTSEMFDVILEQEWACSKCGETYKADQ